MYSFWSHLKPEAKALIKNLMPEGWEPPKYEASIHVHYPDAEECERNMRKVIGEISPVRTKL
jgi:hypothetical protein